MAIFTITSFSTFAGLLLAARGLALDPGPVNRVKALADLATNGKALAAVLRDSGLTPLAAEMARQAEEHARHFTHPGPARDDALALFWQVAPEAFADPAVFAAAGLDPARTTEAMVAAIRASPQGRDFTAAPLPEAFFRAVTRQTLGVMLGKADYIASITPDLWRSLLEKHGVEIEHLERVGAKIDHIEETTQRIDETSIRIERVLLSQSQSRLEDAQRRGESTAIEAVSHLFLEMNALGVSPQQLRYLLSDMRYNRLSIDDVTRLVRRHGEAK